MNLNKVLFNVAVAAAVAAVTAAGTSYLVLRYSPAGKLAGASGPVAADQAASTSTWRAAAGPSLETRPWRAGMLPDWRTVGCSPR